MRKLVTFIVAIVCLITITACGSTTVSDAKTAFQSNDYKTVVSLLENFESEDPEVLSMLLISKIYIAYEDKNYQSVVEQAAELGELSEDMQQMVTLSQANIEFESKNYSEVVSLLSSWENRYDLDLYTISIAYAVDTAFSNYDSTSLLNLYEADKEIEDSLYQLITEKCNSFDYDCFIFAEEFTNVLPDTMLKLELNRYLSNSEKIRVKSFMQGDWIIVYDEATNDTATVRCHVHEDDTQCVGVLIQFSEFMSDYHYAENDMYWTGFTFENNVPVAVNNLVRYTNGDYYYTTAAVELSYEEEQIKIHVTGTTNPDRIYKKVHSE